MVRGVGPFDVGRCTGDSDLVLLDTWWDPFDVGRCVERFEIGDSGLVLIDCFIELVEGGVGTNTTLFWVRCGRVCAVFECPRIDDRFSGENTAVERPRVDDRFGGENIAFERLRDGIRFGSVYTSLEFI